MPRHPIVLISLAVLFETLAVLLFPEYFLILLSLVVLSVILFILTGIKKHSTTLIITVSAILISAAVNPYISYIRNEKGSQEFILEYSEKEDAEYTAVVDKTSGKSFIYAKLLSADGISLTKQHKIRISSYSREAFTMGDIVTFKGKPVFISQAEDDEFKTVPYLKSQYVFIDFPKAVITSSSYGRVISLFGFLRDYSKDTIFRHVRNKSDFDKAGLSYALFTGQKDKLSDEVKRIFSDCSLTHLICVSGLHLFIVAKIFFIILSIFAIPKKQKHIILIALCIFYTFFTGFSLSTVRACIMCIVSFSGEIIGRKSDPFRSLFFSMIVIVLFSPYSVFDAGAVLSFAATFGIICSAKLMPEQKPSGYFANIIHSVIGAAITGTGAVAFTLPVCAYYFSEISTVSVIATLCVSIFIAPLLTLLFLLVAVSPLSFIPLIDKLLEIIGVICYQLCDVIIDIADYFASFRFSRIPPMFEGVLSIIVSFLILAAAISVIFRYGKITKVITCLTVISAFTFLLLSLGNAIYNDRIYEVHYFRKNEEDRQLSVKLGRDGYLIVNADSGITTKISDIPFDYKNGNNHLLLIPDDDIYPYVLAKNIEIFSDKFGLKSISVPGTIEGKRLADELAEHGINCGIFNGTSRLSDVTIGLESNDGYYLSIDGYGVKTGVLFSDNYDASRFDKECSICAFFTRKTKNQFDITEDVAPECDVFITRLKKGYTKDGFINTFGEKRVTIKE